MTPEDQMSQNLLKSVLLVGTPRQKSYGVKTCFWEHLEQRQLLEIGENAIVIGPKTFK
jgi:hypothetical protein